MRRSPRSCRRATRPARSRPPASRAAASTAGGCARVALRARVTCGWNGRGSSLTPRPVRAAPRRACSASTARLDAEQGDGDAAAPDIAAREVEVQRLDRHRVEGVAQGLERDRAAKLPMKCSVACSFTSATGRAPGGQRQASRIATSRARTEASGQSAVKRRRLPAALTARIHRQASSRAPRRNGLSSRTAGGPSSSASRPRSTPRTRPPCR